MSLSSPLTLLDHNRQTSRDGSSLSHNTHNLGKLSQLLISPMDAGGVLGKEAERKSEDQTPCAIERLAHLEQGMVGVLFACKAF